MGAVRDGGRGDGGKGGVCRIGIGRGIGGGVGFGLCEVIGIIRKRVKYMRTKMRKAKRKTTHLPAQSLPKPSKPPSPSPPTPTHTPPAPDTALPIRPSRH